MQRGLSERDRAYFSELRIVLGGGYSPVFAADRERQQEAVGRRQAGQWPVVRGRRLNDVGKYRRTCKHGGWLRAVLNDRLFGRDAQQSAPTPRGRT